jgi:mycothiol synthase
VIRRVETTEDRQSCVDIFADVEPVDRITEDVLATASGSLLLHPDGGYAYVTRSSVEDSAMAMVRVRPSARGQGIGSALLEAAAHQALALGRRKLWGSVRQGDDGSLRFAEGRGLRVVGREVPIRLDVAPGDGAWTPGIVEMGPEHFEGAYAVAAEATPEMALPQIAAAPPFAEWLERAQRFLALAVVALDDDRVVGFAGLHYDPGNPGRLENGLTAVLRSHRRRGIATALKRAQIAWAAEQGFTEIVSEMVEVNASMRAVNARLGYRELPGKIVVEGWPL